MSQHSPVLVGCWSDVGGGLIFLLGPVGQVVLQVSAVFSGVPWFLVVLAI